jgi:hypothetical protein
MGLRVFRGRPKMRKSLWIILTVLLVAIAAPSALANSCTYTYTQVDLGITDFTWTTNAIPCVTSTDTFLPASSLASSSVNPSYVPTPISAVGLDVGFPAGGIETDFGISGGVADGSWTLSEYSTTGTYAESFFAGEETLTLTVAATPVAATPEPSSVALMLLGVGLVFVMRKRIGQGLPQAT